MKSTTCFIFTCIIILSFISCDSSTDKHAAKVVVVDKNVVEVTARDFTFEVADEILSGWTTFRFKNSGQVVSSSVYIYRIQTDDNTQARKMLLLK